MKTFKFGFLGAGKMAEGILQAMFTAKIDASEIIMAEKFAPRKEEMAQRYKVAITENATEVAQCAEIIFLAVKPQDIASLANEVKVFLSKEKLIVSIAAGKSLSTLRASLGNDVRLIRVMPNLALRASEGMCAVCGDVTATKQDIKIVRDILDAAGRTVELEERHFDAVTALSGSGPAFFAFMEQAMVTGGEKLGLAPNDARILAEQTMLGTAAYLRKSGTNLEEFIAGVATKGGTTAAGMDVLRASDFTTTIAATLKAAADRSAELGK